MIKQTTPNNSAKTAAENAAQLAIIRWSVILLVIIGVFLAFFANGIAAYIFAIEGDLFCILVALWRMAKIQNNNAERIAGLLEEQNKLLRAQRSAPAAEPERKAASSQPRAASPFDNRTSDGRFVI